MFLFSSHNRLGPVTQDARFSLPSFPLTANPFKLAVRALRYVRNVAITMDAERKHRAHNVWQVDCAIVFCAAHDHGLIIYHATQQYAVVQLRNAGFGGDVVFFGNDGRRIDQEDDIGDIGWFHYIVRK